jgi:hypothetical protein
MSWLTWKARFTDRCGRGISGVGGSTSFFSQRGKDRAVAGQLKALADDYQRRAKKASHVDAAKALARSAASAERGSCISPEQSGS